MFPWCMHARPACVYIKLLVDEAASQDGANANQTIFCMMGQSFAQTLCSGTAGCVTRCTVATQPVPCSVLIPQTTLYSLPCLCKECTWHVLRAGAAVASFEQGGCWLSCGCASAITTQQVATSRDRTLSAQSHAFMGFHVLRAEGL
jgi:hypothetical protein